MTRTPDEIWADDLLGRRKEATLLIGFIESVFDRATIRDRGHAYTISIDAPYGVGKTFFLRRLAEELGNAHPVAFVDAWSDDLADEPLIALVSTLKAALGPLLNDPATKRDWKAFLSKSGKVAGIVTLGLLKRGAGLLITAPAVDAASDALSASSEAVQDAVEEGLETIATGAIDDLASALKHGPRGLEERIKEFEAGQTAIHEMKASLTALINGLSGTATAPPIVIVIDELDRCRPSYAIKLFEEIKHLFDVPGIIFLFGVHSEQLSHSVKWAYGSDFDGASYLKRFINRQYALPKPDRKRLVDFLLAKSSSRDNEYEFPRSWKGDQGTGRIDLKFLLNWYVDEFDISSRELFEFFDIFETCTAISKGKDLILPYLVPIIVARIRRIQPSSLPWRTTLRKFYLHPEGLEISLDQLFNRYQSISGYTDNQLRDLVNNSDEYIERSAFESAYQDVDAQHLADFRNYGELVSAVLRFGHQDDAK